MAQPVTITLTIEDAAGLYATEETSNPDPQYYSLDDTSDILHEGSGTEFLTNVYFGQNVTWDSFVKVPPATTPYQAGIDKIVFEPGKENDKDYFLGRANDISGTVNSANPGRKGTVTAQVNDKNAIGTAIDVYRIYFTIYPPFKGNPLQFYIDPKLQGHL
ncbi:MAG: hypothetical protein WBM43_08635 [Flavobacteriaceae bacterium]